MEFCKIDPWWRTCSAYGCARTEGCLRRPEKSIYIQLKNYTVNETLKSIYYVHAYTHYTAGVPHPPPA
jgi:hypothetical protein